MPISKLLQKLSNATIKASIAENPAVATASGWTIDNNGEVRQNATDSPGVKQLQKSLAAIGAAGTTVMAAPAIGTALSNPVTQKLIGDTAASVLGGEIVDKTHRALTGQSFGRGVASAFRQQDVYDRSALARFGYDALNPGYFAGNLVAKGTNAAIDAAGSALKNADNYITIRNALRTGKLRFGEPTTYTGIHQSSTPITKPKFPFYERWDVRTHGADPNGFWLTLADSPNTTGTMADRPYASRWSATSKKPLIQTGEVKGLFGKKNNTRNAIVKYGRKQGADAFEFRGIRDNAIPQTDVVMVTEGTNPQYLGEFTEGSYISPKTSYKSIFMEEPIMSSSKGLTEAEKLGIPKSSRSDPRALEDPYYWGYKQWNQRYNKAVETGDMTEAQRLRDLHFSKRAKDNIIINDSGQPIKVYHGSPEEFNIFDYTKTANYPDGHFFFGEDPDYVTSFAKRRARNKGKNSYVTKSYYLYDTEKYPINKNKIDQRIVPHLTDKNGFPQEDELYHDTATYIMTHFQDRPHIIYGYDAGRDYIPGQYDYAVPYNTQMKLTDPITRTDIGEIIPIVKRDNFHNPDIRYKQGGKIKLNN